MNKTTLKLIDGKIVSKDSLFSYHKVIFQREIEYFKYPKNKLNLIQPKT